MEITLTLILLGLIAAETTYLTVQATRKATHSKKQHMPIFVDTSVLIDGRIIAIAESGFITSKLYIPRSVVGELQFLADNGDSDKRSRARHGLDVINDLQQLKTVKTEIFTDSTRAEEGVDNRLLKLAKQYNGAICTIDFNLNKVAQVEGIAVLNVNDLAMNLRMAYLPGEKTMLELTQKGNDSHQAVGHLGDGTMVVVEHASQFVGKTVEVEFIRSLQTAAGKMMFARILGNQQPAKQSKAVQQPARAPKGRQPEKRKEVEQRVSKPVQKQSRPQVQSASQPKAKPQPQNQTKPRNQQRRRNNEDSLIELVNNQ